jgi:ribosomal protein L37AE/L43A
MDDDIDPWGPGGKFIETGLHRVDEPCPRCGAQDVERIYTPPPSLVGEPPIIKCNSCGRTTTLNISTGEWDVG